MECASSPIAILSSTQVFTFSVFSIADGIRSKPRNNEPLRPSKTSIHAFTTFFIRIAPHNCISTLAGSGDDEAAERGEEAMPEKDADGAMVSAAETQPGNEINHACVNSA